MANQSINFTDKGVVSPTVKLILSCVLSIFLIIADSRLAIVQHIRSGLLTILYPVQLLANQPIYLFKSSKEYLSAQDDLIHQNNELKTQNARLSAQLRSQQALNLELKQLKSLHNLSSQLDETVIFAEIISNISNPISGRYSINKGHIHGIKQGQAVVDSHGFLGQITTVGQYSAEITTLNYDNLMIPTMVERTAFKTFIQGKAGDVSLNHFPARESLHVDDILITSGIDDNFPIGIPVAKITHIEKIMGSPYYKTSIQQLANVNKVQHVVILPLNSDTLKNSDPYITDNISENNTGEINE